MPALHDDLSELDRYEPKKGLLSNRNIIISGATDGIGKVLAISCAKHGAELLLLAKNEKKLTTITQELSSFSDAQHRFYPIDFSIAGESDYTKFA